MRRPVPPHAQPPDQTEARAGARLLRTAAAAGLVLVLGGCVVGGTSGAAEPGPGVRTTSPGATSDRATDCTVADLDVGMRDPSDSAGSRVVLLLTFTDTGSRPCTLSGHPGVAFVDGADGDVVGDPAVPTGRSRTVTVLPGDDTTAVLQVAAAGTYPPDACEPTRAAGLRIHAPGATRSGFVRYEGTACRGSTGSPPQLVVQSVGTTVP